MALRLFEAMVRAGARGQRPSRRPMRAALLPCWACVALSASGSAAQEPTGAAAGLDDVVEWLDPLVLEETDETLIGRPGLAIDPEGGFLSADGQASQVRVYGPDGDLVAHFGREGQGPGEFSGLSAVVRRPDGGFAAVDVSGRLSIWTAEGELIEDIATDLTAVSAVGASGDAELAIVTAPRVTSFDDLSVPMVHVFDLASRTITDGLLRLPLTVDNVMAAVTLEGGVPPAYEGRFAVTWPIFDSLWVVDPASRRVEEPIALESASLASNRPIVDRRRDPEGWSAWIRASTLTSKAYPSPAGGWLVTLIRPGEPDDGLRLLHVDRTGARIWEVDAPSPLLAVDAARGVLYFAEPTGLEPGVVWRARLRPAIQPGAVR